MNTPQFWILLDLVLLVLFIVILYKQRDRFKKFLSEDSKKKTDILVSRWLLPFGIALGLYGILWLGFHDTDFVARLRNTLYPPPTINGLDIKPSDNISFEVR